MRAPRFHSMKTGNASAKTKRTRALVDEAREGAREDGVDGAVDARDGQQLLRLEVVQPGLAERVQQRCVCLCQFSMIGVGKVRHTQFSRVARGVSDSRETQPTHR